MDLLQDYAERLPRLVAERALHSAAVIRVGAGVLKASESNRIVRTWQRAARGDEPRPRASAKVLAQILGAAGVEVIREPAKVKPDA